MTRTLLILRALNLGDLLVAVPAVRGLRRRFVAHRLVLATNGWLAPVVELIGGVDELLPVPGLDAPLPLTPGSVDVAANLHGNGVESRALLQALHPRLLIAHRAADGGVAGTSRPGDDPRMPAWDDAVHERERWVRLVRAFGADADPDDVALRRPAAAAPVPHAAVVHVDAGYGARLWPVARFAAVARHVRERGSRVVVTGGPRAHDRAMAVARRAGVPDHDVLAGRIGLADFVAQIASASVVITADTGAGHLASAYGRPSVVLFGPAPVAQWGPPPGPHVVLTDASRRRGDTFSDEPDPALMAVGVRDVVGALHTLGW